MSILIKTFIFKYISWFICSDMYLLHANIQTPGLRKLEKGILIKDMNSKIKAEKCKEKKIHLVLQFSSVYTSDCSSWAEQWRGRDALLLVWPLLWKGLVDPPS